MKKIALTAFTILAMGMLFLSNPAFADDRVNVFEMAESGHTIEFKMTPEEIAAEDLANAKLAATRDAGVNKPVKRVKTFEMGESGHSVSFAMTEAEIAAEDAENNRLAAIRKANPPELKKPVVTYELAESGNKIEFPVESTPEFETEALAGKASADDAIN